MAGGMIITMPHSYHLQISGDTRMVIIDLNTVGAKINKKIRLL